MKKITIFVLVLVMIAGVFSLSACNPPEPVDPSVTKIKIVKTPFKTDYYVGEDISAEGGEIEVTYDNETTATISMADEGVTIDANTNIDANDPPVEGEKNLWVRTVTVRYGDKKDTFDINVSHIEYVVSFDYGYDDKTEQVTVWKGETVAEPALPARSGYKFEGWHTTDERPDEYDFATPVTVDMTLYARWLDDTKPTVRFSFDVAYYGAARKVTNVNIESGSKMTPIADPTREGYKFEGWFTSESGGGKFNFNNEISANTTVYAHWTKTKTGSSTYVFEAEHSDLRGVSGPGLSGMASEGAMIVTDSEHGASNNAFLSYLYESGVRLKFDLAVDEEITDATVTLRLSAEARSFIMDGSNYKVIINSTELSYNAIEFKNVPPINFDKTDCLPFNDYIIGSNVYLQKGSNTITLLTDNDIMLPSTTITAVAPLVDCVKITTTGVVTWAHNLGLPMMWT